MRPCTRRYARDGVGESGRCASVQRRRVYSEMNDAANSTSASAPQRIRVYVYCPSVAGNRRKRKKNCAIRSKGLGNSIGPFHK